jgi:hypothetical protein
MDKCSKCGIYQLSCPHSNKKCFRHTRIFSPKIFIDHVQSFRSHNSKSAFALRLQDVQHSSEPTEDIIDVLHILKK